MRCLWLTLADPEPRHNGQYVYSGGLIDSVAEAGGDVEVLGLGRSAQAETASQRAGHVVWWLPCDVPHSRWGSLASSLPHIAYRCRTSGMQAHPRQAAEARRLGRHRVRRHIDRLGAAPACSTTMPADATGHA